MHLYFNGRWLLLKWARVRMYKWMIGHRNVWQLVVLDPKVTHC